MSLTEQQKQQRLDYITGSDAAIICGVSPWGNIINLWRQKLRLEVAEDISDKPSVKAGNYLEPVVCQWFSDETGINLEEDNNFLIHKEISYMAGNIDRRVVGEPAIFEAKTSGFDHGWGCEGDNTIPDYYLCQVAHYVAVDDCERAYIAVLIGGNDFRHYVYHRNHKLENLIIEKEKLFWDCVKNETPPEPRTSAEIISLYGQAIDCDPIVADSDIADSVEQLKELKAKIKEEQALQAKLEDKIKVYMKDNSLLVGQNNIKLATWNNAKGARRFDASKFEKENPDLYLKYITQSPPTRRFLLK